MESDNAKCKVAKNEKLDPRSFIIKNYWLSGMTKRHFEFLTVIFNFEICIFNFHLTIYPPLRPLRNHIRRR
jgi:hypothetical protein